MSWNQLKNDVASLHEMTSRNFLIVERKLDLVISLLRTTSHLSPEDQAKLNTIFATAAGDSAKIDHAIGSGGNMEEKLTMVDRTIDETIAAVTAEDSRTDSIIAYASGLKDQLAAALANVSVPPDVQAKINQIFDLSTADAAKVDAALNANTPPPGPGPQAGRGR